MAPVISTAATQQEHSWVFPCPVNRTGCSVECPHNFEESVDEANVKIFKKMSKPKRMIKLKRIALVHLKSDWLASKSRRFKGNLKQG